MRRQIVVNEKLTAHKEEGEVVHRPEDQEKPSTVPESVENLCIK